MTHIRRIRGFLAGRPRHTGAPLDCSTAAPPMRATTASRPTDCSGPPQDTGAPRRCALHNRQGGRGRNGIEVWKASGVTVQHCQGGIQLQPSLRAGAWR
jgi:hypothetical protein